MDGNPRIVNGTIDMGAYEFQGAGTAPVIGQVLSIITEVDKSSASPGNSLTYTIRYKNISNRILTNVVIIDKIPQYTTYEQDSVSNNGGYSNGKITWRIESLQSGAGGVLTFRVKISKSIPSGITIKNNATAYCAEASAAVISNYANTIVRAVPVKITHSPVKFWEAPNTSIEIKADISGNVANATLYYWRKGETSCSLVTMTKIESNTCSDINTYIGTIPADAVTVKGVEYCIGASDATTDTYSVSIGYPVLLVHGLNGNTATNWQKANCNFVDRLGQFAQVFTIDLIPANGDIKEVAKQLSLKINLIKQKTKSPQIDLVSYSMGGLVSRWYTRGDLNNSIRKLIMIGTPNHGSGLLYLHDVLHQPENKLDMLQAFKIPVRALIEKIIEGDPFQAGLQMIPNSLFLQELNGDGEDILSPNIKYYTIAGTIAKLDVRFGDSMLRIKGKNDGVVSVKSVKLDNVPNIEVPYNHLNITDNESVCSIVKSILQDTPLPQSAPLLRKASAPDEGTSTTIQHMPIIYGTVSQSEIKSHNIPVDSTILEINFLLGWKGGDIGLTLKAPDGTLITSTSSTEGITYINESQIGVAGYTIKNPEAGTWTVNVNANNVSGVGTYSVEILAESTLVCSLATDKNVYNPGQPVQITAMLTNNNIPFIGASVTVGVITPARIIENILLYDDGTHDDTQANDGTYTNTYANTTMSGNYFVVATAVGNINNQPFVRQENAIYYVEQFPDLTIATSSITFSKNIPTQGEEVTISATINNIGDIAATNTTIFFYDELSSESKTLFGTASIENIPAGGGANASAVWKASCGSHTIYVAISPYNSFLEKDYNNNSAARQIVVDCPDLTVSSADISCIPMCPNQGEMATITVTVYNIGTAKADSVIASFFVGNPFGTGTGIGTQTITTIPANGSSTIQIAWNTTGYIGIIPIHVQLDTENEADKDNNLAYKEVYVQETDIASPTISITNPSSQQTLSGFVDIIAAAADNVGLTKVEFYIDNTLKAVNITEPYSYSWDTTKGSNSSYAIKAIAYDPSGLTGVASMVATVDNSAPIETIPPVFSIAVSPDPAKAGTVSVIVSASEKLISAPNITVKDSSQGVISSELVLNNNPIFGYQATITSSTALGTAAINVSGADLAGNPGSGATTFQIEAIKTQPIPLLGTLSVTSCPTGANILIDGVHKGTTPAELSLQAGSYTLNLTLAHYATYTTAFTIGTGSITIIPATLTATISTHLRIVPSVKNIIKGEEFTVGVEVADVTEMITSSLYLSFNPDVLELQELGTGTFLTEGNVAKRYNNTTGKIDYFVGLFDGFATGSGVICSMRFTAKENGSSSVVFDFDEPRLTRLKDVAESNIPFNKEEAVYYVFTGINGIKIKPQDAAVRADNDIAYQCIAICDNGLEIDVTGSATWTASGNGSFTQNVFLAKYSGTNTVQVEYAGLSSTATVSILPGTPSAIAYVSGNDQADVCSATLKEPFVVKVVDKYNNLCGNMEVIWEVVGGTGYLVATKTTTDILGIASSTLTFGIEPPGTYTIRAICAVLPDLSCTFTARSLRRSGNIAGFCLLDLGGGRLAAVPQIQVSITETGATTTTDEHSYFIFSDIPAGTYTLNLDSRGAGSRVVSNVRISQTQFEPITHIGTITLLSGDINNDSKINLADWPEFADAFFKQKGDADWEVAKTGRF